MIFILSQIVLAQDNTGYFKIKDSYIEVIETSYPEYISLVKKENGKEEITGQVKIVDQYLISDIPENEFLDEYSYLKSGFQDLSISLETDQPLFDKENFYHPPSLLDKTKSLFGFATLPEYRITKEIDKSASVQTELDLSKISLTTHYEKIEAGSLQVKQSLTLTNNSGQDLKLSLLLRNQIEANKIYWNGQEYSITENARKFVNPDRIAFYTPSEEYLSFYDFSDIPDEFSSELWAEKKDSQTVLILSLNIFIPQNSSKTIDPEYSSLKAKEELPEKTTISSKTYIKTLPDLTKTLAWEGTVGPRYFKDNGQWYSHLLIDDRPNKVVLRNAKVAVEVYPGFAKYFDVDYQEERVKKEKWLLERKVGEQWDNIELGSPAMEIIQGEHPAGDYIGVKKIYNTAFGIFEIEYFLRDGNALKHTITFQNTSGKTETFRVIQKWEGIAGEKVNGKDVPLETDSSYLAFHYAGDDPRDFTVSENLFSMMFNEDGTEKTEECLQRPVKIDKDTQGMKADFIYAQWVLAQGESLEIDPGTATLDDPTEDGTIDHHVDSPYEYTRNKTGVDIVVVFSARWSHYAYVEWNISSIPDGATISDVVFKYHGEVNSADAHIHEMLGVQPSAQPDDDTGNQAIYDEIGEGTVYYNTAGFPEVGTDKSADLGTSADSDLQSQLASEDWFAIGLHRDTNAGPAAIYSEDKTDAADPKPTLYVEYTLPLGASCTSDPDCTSGNCTSEGMCCEVGWDGACEVLRPNDAGSETGIWSQYPDSGAHYEKVDEAIPDDYGAIVYYVVQAAGGEDQYDLYALPDPSLSGTINSVKVYIRVFLDGGNDCYAYTKIKTHDTEYTGDANEFNNGDGWINFSKQYNTNPFTTNPWTWAEVNALQAGVRLQTGSPWTQGSWVNCTQVYVYIEYTTNVAPEASSVSIDSDAPSITLNPDSTKNVECKATVTDGDGYGDIESVEMKFYRTTQGDSGDDDNNYRYTLTWPANCSRSNESGDSADFTCTFPVYYYADGTDAGSAYSSDDWTCKVTPSDGAGAGTSDTDTIEMETLLAFDLSPGSIDWETMNLGDKTTTETNETVNIINTGNVKMDVEFRGTDMDCSSGSIGVGNLKYGESNANYDSLAYTLTSSDVEKDWDVLQRTNDTEKTQDQDQKNSYWGIEIPATGVGGSCSGTVTFTAVNDAAPGD